MPISVKASFMRLRQWPGLSIQLLMAASAEDAGACVIQSVVIHAIEQSARAAGRFMNGLSTELLVFVQVGCRVFFEIGFGDFVDGVLLVFNLECNMWIIQCLRK